MITTEIEMNKLRELIPRIVPARFKDMLEHINDSYIKLASMFTFAYSDLVIASKKIEDGELRERLILFLHEFSKYDILYYYIDQHNHSFNKGKYRNLIIYTIAGHENELLEVISFYYKLADSDNSDDFGMSGGFDYFKQ